MNPRRIRAVLKKKKKDGPVLYWMSRDQRVNDNWALIYAQEEARKKKKPVIVLFCLQSEFMAATNRSYQFMIEGLKYVAQNAKKKNIPFLMFSGLPEKIIPPFIKDNSISQLVTDFSPLRIKQDWMKKIKDQIDIPVYEVDAHNIVPCWEVSEKKEYAAYTLRSKISKLLDRYLEYFPEVKAHPYEWNSQFEEPKWENLMKSTKIDEIDYKVNFTPGEKAAGKRLSDFIENKFSRYNSTRNNPNIDGTSNLSPYLHFGQISAQRIVLEAIKAKKLGTLKGTFYDEIIVRRELSDNFCYYEPNYDKVEGFHSWARKSLDAHRGDQREYIYSLEEFEGANTHDNLWNAAQLQMVKYGKMHGYLRMYWSKKILEWTKTPEDAMKVAIYLNNKYELDGRDPNGYAGIAWSIGGVHDRAWKERKIFGKIRYMSFNGMKRKFKVQDYIDKYIN